MRRLEVANMIDLIYKDDEDKRNTAYEYLNKNIDLINQYESLYPVVGKSGKCYLKYIPTANKYLKFSKKLGLSSNIDKFNKAKYKFIA